MDGPCARRAVRAVAGPQRRLHVVLQRRQGPWNRALRNGAEVYEEIRAEVGESARLAARGARLFLLPADFEVRRGICIYPFRLANLTVTFGLTFVGIG